MDSGNLGVKQHNIQSVVNAIGETILSKNEITNQFNTDYIKMGKKMADTLVRDPEHISHKLTLQEEL